MCHTVFYDRFHGLLHYLHHALLYRCQNLTHEPASTQSHQNCVECKDIFKSMQSAVNHFSLFVNFGDVQMDDTEAEQLLDFLDQAVEEGEEPEESTSAGSENPTPTKRKSSGAESCSKKTKASSQSPQAE